VVCSLVVRAPSYKSIGRGSSREASRFQSPLSSDGQSSWLQIQRFWFDSRRYQVFWEVVGLDRGPLSLVSTTEELIEKKVAVPV
jgi:hypothetical protein